MASIAGRSQAAKPHRGAIREEFHSRRHDDSGLSRHFRGARAPLRPFRESMRRVRRRRKPSRRNPTRRQSVRGRAKRRISNAAITADLRCRAIRKGHSGTRLQILPAAVGEQFDCFHQSLRRAARSLQSVRLLRALRLFPVFEGVTANDNTAHPRQPAEPGGPDQRVCDADSPRQHRKDGDRGSLHRRRRTGSRAARRPRRA